MKTRQRLPPPFHVFPNMLVFVSCMHLSNAKGEDQGVIFFYSQLRICGFLLQNAYYNCNEKTLSSLYVGR